MTPEEPVPTEPTEAEADAVEHLWAAAHEFLRAVRKLVDAADDLVEEQRHRPRDAAPEGRLRRIDIDIDAT